MNVRKGLLGVVLAAGLSSFAFVADAKEFKDTAAHIAIDIPDAWTTWSEANYLVAGPTDNSFRIRLVATTGGWADEKAAEKELLQHVGRQLDSVTVSEHAKKINYNGLEGYEVFGDGVFKNGNKAHFFTLILVDKKTPNKGIAVVGIGTPSGFKVHSPGIHEALKTLRATN